MPSNDEVPTILHRALRGKLSKREMAMIGLAPETKAAIIRLIETSPALEDAVLNVADLAYRDGLDAASLGYGDTGCAGIEPEPAKVSNSELRHWKYSEPEPEPEPEPDDCPVCRKIHTVKDIVNLGIEIGSLIPGHEYVVTTKTSAQRYPREWRMGFMGANGYQLEFSARGPDRTHGGQYGGTQAIDRRTITGLHEVAYIARARHVGSAVKAVLDPRS
jgi:hypothetical protein